MSGPSRLERTQGRLRALARAVAALLVVIVLVWLVRLLLVPVVAGVLALLGVMVIVGWLLVRRRIGRERILEIDLDTAPVERAPAGMLGSLTGSRAPLLREVIETITRAGDDPRVVGLLARVGTSGSGLARVQELREAVIAFRASGKRAVAFAETFGEAGGGLADYHLATAFDEIVLQPTGEVGITGLHSEQPFVRGVLDRLGITPRFDHRREFKSALYTLTETGMPPAQREASLALLTDLADQIIADVADRRGLTAERVRELIDTAPLLATEARDAGLVDRLEYHDQVRDRLEQPGARRIDLTSYRGALTRRRGPTIALVHGVGAISRGSSRPSLLTRSMGAGSDDVVAALRAAADGDAAAIVLRVDSPGGSAIASDTILRAVIHARASGTPVVVSMGDVAASGGYYIACGADAIVAQPGTVTGSIGVVAGKLLTREAWREIGVTWDGVAIGDNATMWSAHHDFSESSWARFQAYLDVVYDDFKAKVGEGRGLDPDAVEEIARGRVWSGRQALERGLVDRLGGLDTALAMARELAGIDADADVRLRVSAGSPLPAWRRWLARGTRLDLPADLEAVAALPGPLILPEAIGFGPSATRAGLG